MFQCTLLVVGDAEKAQDSYKARTALKYGIPIVLPKYLEACIEKGRLLDTDPFIVVGNSKAEELSSGKIVGMIVLVPEYITIVAAKLLFKRKDVKCLGKLYQIYGKLYFVPFIAPKQLESVKSNAVHVDLNRLKVWQENDKNAPLVEDNYELVKCVILKV